MRGMWRGRGQRRGGQAVQAASDDTDWPQVAPVCPAPGVGEGWVGEEKDERLCTLELRARSRSG